jgi:hypothetical protein
MRNIVLVGAFTLLIQLGHAQTSENNSQNAVEQRPPQSVSATTDNANNQINNETNTEDRSNAPTTEDKDEAFKREQLRQGRITVNATVVIAIFGGLSFLVAAIYAFVAFKQWQSIEKQANSAKDQVEKMQGQVEIAVRQANAMTEQAGLMRESITQQQAVFDLVERPIVVVESAAMPRHGQNGPIHYSITLVNRGRTPAEDIEVWFSAIFKKPINIPIRDENPAYVPFLGVGVDYGIQCDPRDEITIPPADYKAICDGDLYLIIFGKGSYVDPSGRRHEIKEFVFRFYTQYGFLADGKSARHWREQQNSSQNNTEDAVSN